jgi:hypothetical protein
MSVMSELDYQIEMLACEGVSEKDIAKELNIPLSLVTAWYNQYASSSTLEFPDGYPFEDELSPFSTANS